MNTVWHENEKVRANCEFCQKKFQTRMNVNGTMKSSKCQQCQKIVNSFFPNGTIYSIKKMNEAFTKCMKRAGL